MSTISAIRERAPRPATTPRSGITAAKVLALFGFAIVLYELWTWGGWLAAGPEQITQFRDRDASSWYVARSYEVAIVVVAVVLLAKVWRESRAQRRLSFDGKLIIGFIAAMFWDPFGNFIQPAFFYSSNWVNLNSWTGFAPFVVNPDASRMPEPVFIMLVYPFGLLAFMIAINAGMRAFKRRRPAATDLQIVALCTVAGILAGIALEAPMFLLNLWSLPGAPTELALFDDAHRYAAVEYLTTGLAFAGWAALRYFRDDQGRALTERGLDDLSPGRRTVASVFATVAVCASLLLAVQFFVNLFAFHADPYPEEFPRHLVNDMCDVGETTGTRYGACPGSPEFRMPTPGSLPGPAPFE